MQGLCARRAPRAHAVARALRECTQLEQSAAIAHQRGACNALFNQSLKKNPRAGITSCELGLARMHCAVNNLAL
jgi:hypothetical protein